VTPILVRQTDQPQAFSVGGTIIVQDYWWAGELGRLDLRLRRDGGPFTLMSYIKARKTISPIIDGRMKVE